MNAVPKLFVQVLPELGPTDMSLNGACRLEARLYRSAWDR